MAITKECLVQMPIYQDRDVRVKHVAVRGTANVL